MESGFALLGLALLLPLTVILLVLTGLAAPSARHVNEALIVRAGVTTLTFRLGGLSCSLGRFGDFCDAA